MDIRKLQRIIVDALEDVKAQDIKVFNTEGLTSLFDRVVVASGTSNRQTRALAASVRDRVKDAGGTVKSPEGDASGEWVLVDCGDAVVHIMQPMIRAYYKLEDIWGGKTVHLKALQPASGPATSAGAARAPAKKAAAKTTAVKKTAAKKTAAKTAATAASKPAAKASAPRKTSAATAAKKTAPRTATAKSGTAKPAGKSPAARKTPTRS